jgi:hypothetical protein
MLTKNFYNTLAASGANLGMVGAVKGTKGDDFKYYSGSSAGSNAPLYFFGMNGVTTNAHPTAGCVAVGTGKTPATPDDVMLESPVTSGVSIATQNAVSYSKDDSGVHLCATYGIRNTGSDPLEISEIGCFGTVKTYSGSTSITTVFLVDRTVLETPVVIPPRESRQITYTISLRYPTA